jgi:hypothetical protein
MIKTPDIETIRQYLIRYLPLMNFLDNEPGYGTYIITLHGKRPVKISQVSPGLHLEHAHDENVPDNL